MFDPSQIDFLSQQGLKPAYKFGPGVDPETDWSKWSCLFPHYINSKKKISEGRRIAASKSVEDPSAEEMGMICEHFKLPYIVEFNKAYPRDWLTPGRVRVLFRNEKGALINKEITTKKDLMNKMGELIPQLKSRHVSSSSQAPAATSSKGKKKKH